MFDFFKKKASMIEMKVFNDKTYTLDSAAQDPKLFKDRKCELYKKGYSYRVERVGLGKYVLWSVKKHKGGVKNA